MTKSEAMRIGKSLAEAVDAGVITSMQAKNRFKLVAREYKRQERFKSLQKIDPKLWMAVCNLLGGK